MKDSEYNRESKEIFKSFFHCYLERKTKIDNQITCYEKKED
jgi:hypothetical protein